MLSLFRLVEAENEHSIIVNGQYASKMGLHTLRNTISIIPQEPIMFSGRFVLHHEQSQQSQ